VAPCGACEYVCVYFSSESSVSLSVSKNWRDSRFFFRRPAVLERIGVVGRGLIGGPIVRSSGNGSDSLGGHRELMLVYLCRRDRFRRGSLTRELSSGSSRGISLHRKRVIPESSGFSVDDFSVKQCGGPE